jgi:hypothetical protein
MGPWYGCEEARTSYITLSLDIRPLHVSAEWLKPFFLEAGHSSLAMTFMTRPGHALTWFTRYLIAIPVKFPFPAFSLSLSLTIHY